MKKTCHGSCHCGAVRFTAEIDLAAPSLRCNCSFCLKVRCWASLVPPADFRLLAGAADLGEYRFGARRESHYFCRHCGVRPFGRGDSPRIGPFVGISVSCLDDVSAAELAQLPVTLSMAGTTRGMRRRRNAGIYKSENEKWFIATTEFSYVATRSVPMAKPEADGENGLNGARQRRMTGRSVRVALQYADVDAYNHRGNDHDFEQQ